MRPPADIYTDFSHLAELKRKSRQDGDAALKEVAKQFEAMFLQMVLKQMRQASPGDPIFDSDRSRFYQEMHDQQLALHLSQGGSVGIADMIVRQLGGHPLPQVEPQPSAEHRTAIPSIPYPSEKEAPETVPLRPAGKNHLTHPIVTKSQPSSPATTANQNTGAAQPSRFDSPQQFIRYLSPLAERAAAKIGVDPGILLAQAALETGWGKKVIRHPDGSSSHNLFNIKAGRHWEGSRVRIDTLEHIDGIAVRKRADFRAYEDYQQSFEDYVELLRKPRYAPTLRHARDPEKYIRALQDSGYATDPDYADKILTIYRHQTLASR